MEPLSWVAIGGTIRKALSNKYVKIILVVAAMIGIGAWYFNHKVDEAVTVKVEEHDTYASQQVGQVQGKIEEAVKPIDKRYDDLEITTAKDYDDVLTSLPPTVEPSATDAPLDPVLLDTLNRIAGLHAKTASDRVPSVPD